jgi:rubrerythrin
MGSSEKINGCIAIEQAIASIYSTFMKLFPGEKDFWEGLYRDEIDHSSFLQDASSLMIFSELPPQAQPPLVSFIVKTLEFTQNTKKQILLNPISLEDALHIAWKLEETMVETYTNVLITDSKAIDDKSYFMDLEKMLFEERGHINKIKNMMIGKGFLKIS